MQAQPVAIAICSVGSEIVAGEQVDTNAAWLAQRVREIGGVVACTVAVGDDHGDVVAALRWLFDRADAVVVGGGLGPTPDDLTRAAVASAVGRGLVRDERLADLIRERFASRGARMPEANLRQAAVPAGAEPFDPVGTAPGFRVPAPEDARARDVYVLPGVPWEFQQLFRRDVAPHLLARVGGGATVTRVLHVTDMGESAVAEAVAPVVSDLDPGRGTVSYLATGDEVQVRVTVRADDAESAREASAPVVEALRERLGRAVAGLDDRTVEAAVVERLRARSETVAVAESATGGAVVARLISVPGASQVVRGGVVAYSDAAKRDVVGVSADLLERHGSVGEPVTRELALRVRERFGADWGVATTGVAGPDPVADLAVGTAVWAVAGPHGGLTVRTGRFDGDREAIQKRLTGAALEALRRRAAEDEPHA